MPLSFVVSGIRFDLEALTSGPATLLRLPLFLAVFSVARGVAVLLLHRRDVPRRDRLAMALLASTAPPLVGL